METIAPVGSPQVIVNSSTRIVVEPTSVEGKNKIVEKTYLTIDFYDKYGNIKTANRTNVVDYIV